MEACTYVLILYRCIYMHLKKEKEKEIMKKYEIIKKMSFFHYFSYFFIHILRVFITCLQLGKIEKIEKSSKIAKSTPKV